MRILIPNHFPLEGSGSGIYTQNVARELVSKGHQALTITPAHEEQTGFPFEARTILFTADGAAPVGGGQLPFNFPCFTTHPVSNTQFGGLAPGQREAYVSAWRKAIAQAIGDWQPDVIHAQHLWTTGYVAGEMGVPCVATAHGTDLMGFRQFAEWQAMALEGTDHLHAVIAISRQVSADTQDLYDVPLKKIRLVWNGFDEHIFKVLPVERAEVLGGFGLPSTPQRVVSFVGKLTGFKGVDVLLDAAVLYERELGDTLTLIVGDGQLREDLENQARDLKLKGVHFLGHQNQPDVARIYNVADVSVVPSRVEPFGLVAIEAMACGTPVVATNEGGLPDFVNDTVGALVPVGDVAALAAAIVKEARAADRQAKGSFAADYALKGFSWAGQVDRMVTIYEEALRG